MAVPWYVDRVSQISQVAKYVFLAATTGLTVYSMLNEATLKTKDPLKRKTLTPAGRRYLLILSFLTFLTVLAAAGADWADKWIKDDDRANFESNLDGKLKEKNTQLKAALDPILTHLKEQVTNTTNALETTVSTSAQQTQDNLIEKNKQSNDTIQSIQRKLLQSSEESSQKILLANQKESDSIYDIESSLTEGPMPIKSFNVTITDPSAGHIASKDLDEWKVVYSESKQLEYRVCATNPHSQYWNQPNNPCDTFFQSNKSWEETYEFAKSIYPGKGFSLFLSLGLRNFVVRVSDSDSCILGLQKVPNFPCLRQAIDLGYTGSGKFVPAFLGGFGAAGIGISIGVDGEEGLSKLGKYYARDAEVKSLEIMICKDTRSNSLSSGEEFADEQSKLEGALVGYSQNLPQTMLVTIYEDTAGQQISHSYKFIANGRGQIVSAGSCISVPYTR